MGKIQSPLLYDVLYFSLAAFFYTLGTVSVILKHDRSGSYKKFVFSRNSHSIASTLIALFYRLSYYL